MCCGSSTEREAAVDNLLSWAKTLVSWSKEFASIIPVPAFGPIASVMINLIDLVAAARTNKQAIAALLENIRTLASIIEESKKDVDSRIAQLSEADRQLVQSESFHLSPVQNHFSQFQEDLEKLKVRASDLKHTRYLPSCIFASVDAQTIKDIQGGVTNATTYFQTKCQIAVEGYLRAIDERLRNIENMVHSTAQMVQKGETAREDDVDERILESLPHADAGYRASINELKSVFLDGTRSGLFAELDRWVEGDLSGRSGCVLVGGAGTGKSTIASELANRLEHRYGKLGASFFFVRGVTDLDSTRVFFPTIAYQLAHWSDGVLRKLIVDAAREHLKKGRTQAMKYEAPALLHGPLSIADKEHPIFLVVDAVDECTQNALRLVPEMLELLMQCTQHRPLRVFLTFRPEQLIEAKLMSSQWSHAIHTISIDTFSDDAIHDVAAFIKDRLSQMPLGLELLERRPDVANRLAARAQGLFIYARTAMDFLETYLGRLEEGVKLLLSDEEGPVVLEPLDQLYLTVLINAFPPSSLQDSASRIRLQSVLTCIALLRNPMSPRVLEALTSKTDAPIICKDTEPLLGRLRSVVVFKRDAPDEAFRPMHATFPQFLIDKDRCTNAHYLVRTQRSHARLAEACLRTLLSLTKNMCQLDDTELKASSIGDVPGLQDRVREHILQHVQYACVHWAAHLREACGPGEHAGNGCFCKDLVVLLEKAVSTKMLQWLETLGYMGRVDGAMDALTTARDWLPADAQYSTLRASINNGRQILFNYTDDIRECPHSVYSVTIAQDGSRPAISSPLSPGITIRII